MKLSILAAVAVLSPVAALAHDGMHANDAYARSTNPKVGAVFMQMENHRQVACTLQGVSSDAAERVELHTHVEEGGVMKMTRIEDGIAVAAGQTHALNRGGDHIMMLGLAKPLADGDTLTLSMDFGDCGTEEVQVVVDNQREDAAPADHDHDHGDHQGH